jgi:cytoskeletal protein RodZ
MVIERLTLGQYFRSERERRGISLKDIERRTKISCQTLAWLEEDNLEILPPRAFLRGFLQVISKEFGMDESELFRLMDESLYKIEKVKMLPPGRIDPPSKARKRMYLYIAAAVLGIAIIITGAVCALRYREISSTDLEQHIKTANMQVHEPSINLSA